MVVWSASSRWVLYTKPQKKPTKTITPKCSCECCVCVCVCVCVFVCLCVSPPKTQTFAHVWRFDGWKAVFMAPLLFLIGRSDNATFSLYLNWLTDSAEYHSDAGCGSKSFSKSQPQISPEKRRKVALSAQLWWLQDALFSCFACVWLEYARTVEGKLTEWVFERLALCLSSQWIRSCFVGK